ncbi:hypothetical protein E2C01_084465 [Portunus trituberculatus]|uniref:Uncharacterized protein n=1 Tax=Portunus trituberculatus TaxID=210409 RepID=A0A5B7JAU4_PORTR|nr:hypothetical protein [Portunus trituberculatus]
MREAARRRQACTLGSHCMSKVCSRVIVGESDRLLLSGNAEAGTGFSPIPGGVEAAFNSQRWTCGCHVSTVNRLVVAANVQRITQQAKVATKNLLESLSPATPYVIF